MKKNLLLISLVLMLNGYVIAQSPSIFPEPGAVSWCPDNEETYEVRTAGAQQTSCSYKWTITNGTIVGGNDANRMVTVKWNNTTSKGTLKITLTNCSEASNASVTSEYIIRSLTAQSLANPRALSSLPYCSTASIVAQVDEMKIPNTGGTSPVSQQYADGYEWAIPAGWSVSGYSGNPVSTSEPFITLVQAQV